MYLLDLEDIHPLTPVVLFLDNPFTRDVSISVMAANMQILWGDEGAVQLKIIEMQHNMALWDKRKDTTPTEFWMKYLSCDEFPHISKCCKKLLTMFGSTYVYEAGFSAMTNIKSNSLTDENLESLMRAAVTQYQPQKKHKNC